MLSKRGFGGVWSRGLVLCLVFSVMLLATVPLMAQDKSLEEKLEEAKAAIEDQEWVIRQLEKNFFKVVAELNEELDFLRALSGKQLEEIDSYLKEIASLKLASIEKALELVQLESITAEQAKKVGELEAVKEEQAKELAQVEAELAQVESIKAEQARKLAQLEAIKAEQAERIERINTLFGKAIDRMKAEIDSLNIKNAELVAAKDLLQTRLDVIDEKYTQIVKEYEEQLLAAERLRDAYWKAQVKLAEKDRELAFFEEETAELDKEIASLKAEAAKLEAANARLRRHRLLLGLGFIAAAYMACSAD